MSGHLLAVLLLIGVGLLVHFGPKNMKSKEDFELHLGHAAWAGAFLYCVGWFFVKG